jgi:GH25 family lysozyme M1 (1,4-beta-N-acetylmuramidase)
MDCPYRGLVPYSDSPEDVRLFFGRDTEQRILIDNLTTTRLSIVYGESGVGKSSVLYAGVAAKLRADPDSIVVVYNSWYIDPVFGLTQAVRAAAGDRSAEISVDSLTGALSDLVKVTNRRALVILDQFEEYFQYHGGKTGTSSWAEQFSAAVLNPSLDANFLLSIRSDSLALLDFFKARIPHLLRNRIALRHLAVKGAYEAIEQPLNEYNKDVPAPERVTLEPENLLAKKIVEQIGRKPEDAQDSDAIEVPATYLQLVLTRLWHRERELRSNILRAATLAALGGGERIYEEYFSSTVNRELDWQQRRLAIVLFKYLITSTGRKITTSDKELSLYDDLKKKPFLPILEKLRKARVLVTVPPPPGEPAPPNGQPGPVYYQFAHDVLARAACHWRVQQAEAHQRTFRLSVWVVAAAFLAAVVVEVGIHQFLQHAQQEAENAAHQAQLAATQAQLAVTKAGEGRTAAEAEVLQLQDSLIAAPSIASPANSSLPAGEVGGIDISKYTQGVDWAKLKQARVAFVYIRATQGTTLTDSQFADAWSKARQAGIRRGAYHVYRASEDPLQQAHYFLSVLGALQNDDLPPAIAISTLPGTPDPAPAVLSNGLVQCLQEVENTLHRKPLINGPSYWIQEHLTGDAIHTYPLWLSQYGPKCRTPSGWLRWTLWQYTATGRVDGVTGVAHLNKFNGSAADFDKLR